MRVDNGDRVKDTISGFMGIVTCRLEYLNGCTRIQVSPEILNEGKPIESQYFDEPQVEVIEKGLYKGVNATGGFKPQPSERLIDRR